jgi:hypothetical protein
MTTFADVARLIADPPPPWLEPVLEQFSEWVNDDITSEKRERFHAAIVRAYHAAQFLAEFLPAFNAMPRGLKVPPAVTACLNALPGVIRELKRVQPKPHLGRRPQTAREICAAIVLENWRLIHGSGGARTERLQEACNAYWSACGCREIGETGDIENWRRPLQAAIATNYVWLREALATVQNCP